MTLRRWQVLLAFGLLAVALSLVACGDDEDGDGTASTATAAADETPDAPAETPEGGDRAETATETGETATEATGTSTATPGETSTAEPGDTSTPLPAVDFDEEDAAYASALCGAFAGFYDSFQEAFLDTPTEDSNPLEGFTEVFTELRDDIRAIEPPDRYAEFHDQALAVYEQLVEDLQEGNPEPLAGIDVPEVDPDLQARLASAAAQDPVCQQVEEDFGIGLFGEQ